MKKAIFLLVLFPLHILGQWNQLGFINGQAANDRLGIANTISFDSAGVTMAVGSPTNSQLGTFFGYAKVFAWNGTQWIQKGQSILGSAVFEGTGGSVDLTADGNTLVVSSPYGFNTMNWKVGLVRVFDWNGTQWIQRGNTLEGEGNVAPLLRDDNFGFGVSISPNGQFLAVGAPRNTKQAGVLQFQGQVRVYQWNGQSWIQMGQDIDGVVGLEDFGRHLNISADGSMLAVSSRGYRTLNANNNIGSVQTFQWNGTDWVQFGQRIEGIGQSDRFGSSVSMSSNGSTLAVGSRSVNGAESAILVFAKGSNTWVLKGLPLLGIPNDLGGGTCALNANGNSLAVGFASANSLIGFARIYDWNGSSWTQIGNDIVPPTGSTFPGFGSEIRINHNGSRVLIGASGDDAAGDNAGRVYAFTNAAVNTHTFDLHQQFEVYPNPTSSYIRVKSSAHIDSYALYTLEGKRVKSESFVGSNDFLIGLDDLGAGFYLLQTNTNGLTKSTKIIKQ